MRLRFPPGDHDGHDYYATRDRLLDEFADWLGRPAFGYADLVCDAELFLDWRYDYSNGVLDEFSDEDLVEFLVEWCPRKLAAQSDLADAICDAVASYIEFMADTDRLVGGVHRAAMLATSATGLAAQMRSEMNSPANFGMANALAAGLGDISDMSDDELEAALSARIDARNAPPFEQHGTLTDRFFEPAPESEPCRLPFVYVTPTASDVEAAAAEAPILAKVGALRDYLGAEGKPLTDKGRLKLADGRALIDVLDTGDEMDPDISDKSARTVSTANLPRLTFLLDVAKKAGAVRVHQRRLVPTKAWAARRTVQQATALLSSTLELGPLQSLFSGRAWFVDELHRLLDDGIPLWLSPLLGPCTSGHFGDLLDLPKMVASQQLAPDWPRAFPGDSIDTLTVRDMSTVFEILDLAGAVQWTNRTKVPKSFESVSWTSGIVAMTALGRHVLPDYLEDIGVALRRADDLSGADAAALIETLPAVDATQHRQLLECWQQDRPPGERVRQLVDAVVAAPSAEHRVVGFHALGWCDVTEAEPVIRQLLDGPVAGHAALWLIGHGCADSETLGSFIDTAVYVDLLSSVLDEPEQLCRNFADAGDAFALLDDMWRHPAPETAEVLDVLGRHLEDPALAKAARKSAMRHRTWMADRA